MWTDYPARLDPRDRSAILDPQASLATLELRVTEAVRAPREAWVSRDHVVPVVHRVRRANLEFLVPKAWTVHLVKREEGESPVHQGQQGSLVPGVHLG